jgi:hypothetical protein
MQLSCPRATREVSGQDRPAVDKWRVHYGLLFSVPSLRVHAYSHLSVEPCQACDFKKCVRSFPWLKCWTCWGLSVTSDHATKSGVLAQCMARRRPRAGASRPTSRGMFTSAFDADRQGTTSISTQPQPTSRCLQLQSICVLVLELQFRGSKRNEPAAASWRPVAKIARPATPILSCFKPRPWHLFKPRATPTRYHGKPNCTSASPGNVYWPFG